MKKTFMVCACTCVISAIAAAQDGQKDGFKSSATLGFTLTDGNSETMQANAALKTEGEKEGLGSVRAGMEWNYGKSTVDDSKDTTIENAEAFANIKKTISKMTFAALDTTLFYDEIAEIDYRITLSPALGAYLIKNEHTSLSMEAGPAYVWEKVSGVSDDYIAARFAEYFSYTISDTAKIWQSVNYLPKADNFGNFLLTMEAGIEAAINSRFNLRLVLKDRYDSKPKEDMKKNDLTLIAGIGIIL